MALNARVRTDASAVTRDRTVDSNWLILLGLILLTWAPLVYPGYFQVHQGFLPLYHLNDLAAHPAWGWLPVLGQPADLWRGEGPLPYLLGWVLRPLGAPVVVKGLLALALMAGPLALYGALRRWFGPRPALVAAVLYAYLPFTLTTVYVRGAIAETILWALVPLVLWWSDLALDRHRSWLWGLAAAVVASAMVWVQAGLAVMALLVVALALWLARPADDPVPGSRRRWAPLVPLLGALAGLGLRLTWNGSQAAGVIDYMAHRVELFQLFAVGPGTGTSVPGWQDTLSFQVGVVATGIALLALIPLPHGSLRRPVMFWASVVLLAVLVALAPVPLGAVMTYPWQLLGLAGLGLCILAAAGLARYPALTEWPVLSALAVTAILAGYAYLVPRYTAVQPRLAPVATFGGFERGVVLVDETTVGALVPGSTISTTLTWQALHVPDFDYNLFAHLVDDTGRRWGQTDQQPLPDRPMTDWAVGEIVTGTVGLAVDPAVPPGTPLHLVLGLYNWQDGQRLLAGEADQVTVLEGTAGR